MACCIFKGCFNRPTPFGTVTFFNLPKDEPRRGRWLWLSGNADVQNLPANARRLVCEEHFEERYIRRQFHRTTLSREAVPMEHHQVRKAKQAATADEILIDEMRENVKNEETPSTDQEEILLISADEESEYEVLVEESETLQETNEDHETHLIEVEESNDGLEVMDTIQGVVIGDRNTLIRCREDAVVLDGLAQESKNVVDTILIDFEESCEEQKSQEIVENTEESQLEEVIQHECAVEEKPGENPQGTHDLVETLVIDDVESSGVHKALASIPQDITITKQNSEHKLEHGNSFQEHKTEAEEVELTNKKPQVIVTYSAKHKIPHNVNSTQQTKRFKNDEVVEPDTSSQSDPPKPQVVATEQPSTSSCTSSVPASSQRDLPKPKVVTIEQPSTSSCTSSVPPASTASGKMSEEEYFAMSLVGPLQRLPPERRAIAKMKILTYLVQLECGMTDASL